MSLSTAILVCFLAIIGGAFGGRYSGQQTAQSEGDDPNASGLLNLQTARDTLTFNSTLFNAFNVTGVHLHLSSPRGAVFGGPLVLALTNTTAANGQAPVSSTNGPLLQNGQRSSSDLQANPMLAVVRQQLGGLGISGNDVRTIGDVANLIEAGLIYTDVHTTVRVSPQGLLRGAVTELACPFPSATAPPTSPGSPPINPPSNPSSPPSASPPASPTAPPQTPSSPPSTAPPQTPSSPPSTAPPSFGVRNPCYCSPQQGVGSDGYQYCFNFVQATSDVNCNPPAGSRCNVIQATSGWFTNVGGPVYQCTY